MRRMNDDEVMDYAYNKLFGDLDGIRSAGMFNEDEDESHLEGMTPEAGKEGIAGIELTVKPIMKGAEEGGREEEDEEDRLKGIGQVSPLMAQLHGER